MTQVNSWKAHFLQLPSNEDANKNLTAFAKDSMVDTTNPDGFAAQILRAVANDINSVILAKSPASSHLTLYHSITDLGGTRARPGHKIVGLLGSGPDATAVTFDQASIQKLVHLDCPNNTTLRAISDKNNVASATISATRPQKFQGAIFQFLPPFISSPLFELEEKDPAQLLVEVNSLITSFDAAHNGDTNFPSATDVCKGLRAFLWAAATDNIPALNCAPDPDDAELQAFKKTRSSACILPPSISPDPNTQPLANTDAVQQLAASVQNQTNLMEEIKKGREDAKEEKKTKFSDLHDSCQRLILNASSQNGVVAAGKPSSHCEEFYRKSSAAKAGNYLASILKDVYGCHPDFQQGFIQAIYDGHYLRDREDSPSNFSFFLCPRMQPLSAGNRKETTILQIKIKQGKGWTEKDYDAAVKQGISTPSDINTANHQFKIWWGCGSALFGDNSKFPAAIAELLQLISRHCITFEAQQLNDNNFFTKFGYQVDTRVFRWLQQCESCEDREDVDDSLIDFKPLVQAVLNDQFIQRLPCTFKSIDSDEPEPLASKNPKKRKHDGNQEESRLQRNSSPIDDWIVPKDIYRKNFAGKHLDDLPIFKDRPMCHRFHSKGHCFSDCINAVSHIPSTDLDDKTKAAYSVYCKKCQSSK